jgi:hypothetical protein
VRPWTLYHSGDCVPYDGLATRVRALAGGRVDVALLPINGRAPERGVAGNFDGPEAARLARDVGAAVACPMHYEMFASTPPRPTRSSPRRRASGSAARCSAAASAGGATRDPGATDDHRPARPESLTRRGFVGATLGPRSAP